MAIDDNTTYGLTGAQVKELPERINAVKGTAKKLTSADYNWNSTAQDDTTTPFDSIAYWKLSAGHYYSESGTVFCYLKSSGSTDSYARGIIVIEGDTNVKILESAGTGNAILRTFTNSGNNSYTYKILQASDIKDNLTSASSQTVLSANQGKVLNEKIQAISDYSTSEVDTGATWIDGSTIYKKTIDIGTPADSATKLVAHGITNLGTVVKMEGMLNGPSIVPLPFTSTSSSPNNVEIVLDTTNIRVITGSSWWNSNNYVGHITLYYTKSS